MRLVTENRVYSYPWDVVAKEYLVIGAGVLLPIGLIYYCETSDKLAEAIADLPFGLDLMLGSAPLIMFATLVYTIAIRRPISVDSSGITVSFLEHLLKHFTWSEISRIEKVRVRNPVYGGYMFLYFVRSARGTIRFQDDLGNVQAFLSQVNDYARSYNIELVLVDRGRDALVEALSTTSDPIHRKSLRRDGVRRAITSL